MKINFMSGYKTYVVFGASLAVALFQQFVAPIPAVDPEVWAMVLPIAGIILRFVTKGPAAGTK